LANIHVVYALHSEEHNKLYIGETAQLIDRFYSHNFKATKGYTIHYRPWKVIHVEFFASRAEALIREKQLKSAKGRNFLRTCI
jgi:putative endonuclease